jgi:hypothetical protein
MKLQSSVKGLMVTVRRETRGEEEEGGRYLDVTMIQLPIQEGK